MNLFRFAPLILALFLLPSPGVNAQDKKGVSAKPTSVSQVSPRRGPYQDFRTLTRDATQLSGFFDIWRTQSKLLLAIPESRLGQPFLMASQVSRGIGMRGLVGGRMAEKEARIVALERWGDKVFLVQRPVRFTAPEGSAEDVAVQASYGSSVLESASVAAIHQPPSKDGESRVERQIIIDIQPWLVSDLSGLSERIRGVLGDGSGKAARVVFDRSRSYITSVRAFPRNVNFKASLTFRPGAPREMETVPDERYVPITVYHTFAALPEEPMTPRAADPRVGFFVTARKDFSKVDDPFVRMVRRWRLEPGEETGDLVRPKKPITFRLGPGVPPVWRDTVREGVLAWNKAFESAGFKDAIRVVDLPPGIEPEDIRFATIRWSASNRTVYDALGQTLTDPRTGEILDADILVEAGLMNKFGRIWRRERPMSDGSNAFGSHGCSGSYLEEMSMQAHLGALALAASGHAGSGDGAPPEFLKEALKAVIMHEVGHGLGLAHNFQSSSDTPFEKLHDRQWVAEHGLVSSVMDYAAINLAPQGVENGYFYTPVIGKGDVWAISYGYTPDAENAAGLARKGAALGLSYGSDRDAKRAAALDPRISAWDLSDNPLAWSSQRTALIRGLWARIPELVLTDNVSYEEVTLTFDSTLSQYAQALGPALKYVGGQQVNRDHYGDPQGRPPFVAVPLGQQRHALKFLAENAFSERAFQAPPQMLALLGGLKWEHWGRPEDFKGRQDYPFHREVLVLQTTLLKKLMHPQRLASMRDAAYKFGEDQVLGVPELLETLMGAVWTEVGQGVDIKGTRRDLQRTHLDLMLAMMKSSKGHGDARAISRWLLKDLAAQMKASVDQGSDLNTYTRAHLDEVRDRIDHALAL